MRSKLVHGVFIKLSFIHFIKGLNFEEYVIVVFVMSPFYEKEQYTVLEPDAVPAIGTAYLPLFFCGYLFVFDVHACVCVCGVKFIVSLFPQLYKGEASFLS